MKKYAWIPVALAVTFFLLRGMAQGRLPSFNEKSVSELDSVFQRAVQTGVVPGVVAIVANKEKVIYEGAFGSRDVANKKAMPRDGIFRIASMTKPVTSMAVMMLVEEGKLRLDDPVSKFIPQFKDRPILVSLNSANKTFTTKKAEHEVLIRHLLTNTSGLAYTFAHDQENRLQQLLKAGEEPPLLYEPGTQWTYSGSAKVLGQIVEKISGMPLDRFFEQRIFKPLGLTDTSYAVPAEKMSRVATTHQRQDGKLVESSNPDKIQWAVVGDGGLNSTARDYVKFLQVFLNEGQAPSGRLLRKESIQAMISNQIGSVIVQQQVTIDPSWSLSFPIGAGRDKFGFGFQITSPGPESANLRSQGSYSWAGIFNTHFWGDPKRQIAAVIMMQVTPFYDQGSMAVYRDFEAAIGRNLR